MKISRKDFFKLGLFSGLSAALPAEAAKSLLQPKEDPPPPLNEESFAHTVCGLCPAGCGMRVRRVDGKPVGVSGIPDHPVNHGGLCPKGAAALQELYHPDRVRTPLARNGPRGSGAWNEISWEEALRMLAEKIAQAGSGFASLTSARAWDIQGELLKGLADAAGKGRFLALGFPLAEFPADAYELMQGSRQVAFHISRADLLASFGFDWLQSYPSPVEAQSAFARLRRGLGGRRPRIVQIEPRFSATAGKADRWVPVYPAAEGLLALALAKKLVADDAYDKAFVRDQSHGFEDLRKSLDALSFEDISRATGVAQKELLSLTAEFSRLRPAAAITHRGPLLTQLSVHALNALLGGIGKDGAFSGMEPKESFREDIPAAQSLQERPPRALLVDRANPRFLSPLQWKELLDRTPFVATVSAFMSETAESSDLVLPCHTPLERSHCCSHISPDGSVVLSAAPKAVEPLYDSKDPGEIFLAMTRTLRKEGLPADFDSLFMGRVKQLQLEKPFAQSGVERMWRETGGPAAASPPRATPSGRFEFDALTRLLSRQDLRKRGVDRDYPLHLYLCAPLAFSFGEGAHLPYLQSVAGFETQEAWETWAEMHPDTGAKRGIAHGEAIWIESRKGKIKARALLSRAAMPGVVSLPLGLGHAAYGRWAKGVGANPLELGEAGSRVRLWKS